MKSLKNMLKRFEGTFLYRIVTNKYLCVTAIFLVWIVFFDDNSVIQYVRVLFSNRAQSHTIRQMRTEIEQMDSKLRELDSNLDSLEKFAREQYYFHKPEETVYIVVEE